MTSGGKTRDMFKLVLLEDPLVVTSGGSHGGQAGGAHPTRIPYRFFFRLVADNIYCSTPLKAR